MNFFIGIFQGFWLQISEHLFSRTPLTWLLLQRRIQDLIKMELFCEYNERLKAVNYIYKKLHLRCFTRFCVHLCSEVTSSIYETYKVKVYCKSFWRHCNVFDVFSGIKETLRPLINVTSSKNLELLCDCIFATNTKTIIYIM